MTSVEPQPSLPPETRDFLRALWGQAAGSWAEHAAFVDARHLAVTSRMLDLAAPGPADRVLELACGPGGAGLAAAERVAPGGAVVLSDVAPEMVEIAAARAAALGLTNVSARPLDLEAIDEPEASYDVVLSRDGLQFAIDPARAAAEIARVLRPGGRVAVAVWGPRDRNPWLGLVLDALSEHLGRPTPPPGVPGPFSLGDRDELRGLLAGAGLAGVTVDELPVPLHAPSFELWWAMTTALAGPLKMILAGLPDEDVLAVQAIVRRSAHSYERADGLVLPGMTLVAGARR
jgi:SAM-dependent methyltransferase